MLPTDFSPLRLSTCGLLERERVPTWREQFCRALLRVDIEPKEGLPFYAAAELRALPELRVVKGTWSAARFWRNRVLAADGDDSIGIIVGEGCTASQRGRDVVVNAGDGVAVLSQEPVDVTFAEGSVFSVVVPRDALAGRVRSIDDSALQLIPRRSETLRLLLRYLKSFETSPELRKAVASHVHDLMALALTRHPPLGESDLAAVGATRLNLALDHIAGRFQDPELSLTKVARSMGISPRYLQRLLEKGGVSFRAQVTELRLKRAFVLLTEQSEHKLRISDVALQAGFSDISHFNRLFRSRFGDTPGGVRARADKVIQSEPPLALHCERAIRRTGSSS
jgi:AraC-like DNA-binding protein